MKKLTFGPLLLALCGLLLAGCKKDAKPATDNKKMTSKRATPRRAAPKATKQAAKDWTVGAYEQIRLALAADELDKTKSAAKALATQATSAAGKAEGATKTTFSAMATASTKISGAKDFAAARLAFGELSKQVITYLSADAARSKGLTAYTCPMAKGYKKWIQADAEMANPYMGKRMLKCGGKTKLSP